MTTPQQQCTNLELSKKLKDLGYPQESLFYWNTIKEKVLAGYHLPVAPVDFKDKFISAPTVAELGEKLPAEVISSKSKENGLWTTEFLHNRCWFEDGGNYPPNSAYGEADTEADARAKMLIYLLENKLIEL